MNIVSLLPSTTEICYALDLGDQVRGVTHECDYPPDARGKAHLTKSFLPEGDHSSAEIDRMVSERVLSGGSLYDLDRDLLARLEPDLILTQELCEVCAVAYEDVLAAARSLPKTPRVMSFEPASVGDIFQSIEEVAGSAGRPKSGTRLVAGLRSRLDELSRRLDGVEPLRVVCLEWLDPPMVGGHWVPEMVRLAGGIDVLGPEGQPSPRVTWQQVVDARPEAIILMPCGYDLDQTLREAEVLESNAALQDLDAVRGNRVYAVDGSAYFNRPGPRVIDGIELLARLLHPSRCAGLGPCGAARRYRLSGQVARSG